MWNTLKETQVRGRFNIYPFLHSMLSIALHPSHEKYLKIEYL